MLRLPRFDYRRPATLAIVLSLVLTVAWGIVLATLLKWWASNVA